MLQVYLQVLSNSSHGGGNLDYRIDTPDAIITNDTDLLLQFLFEFVFGGLPGCSFEMGVS